MNMKKRAFALVLALVCLVMSFAVFAEQDNGQAQNPSQMQQPADGQDDVPKQELDGYKAYVNRVEKEGLISDFFEEKLDADVIAVVSNSKLSDEEIRSILEKTISKEALVSLLAKIDPEGFEKNYKGKDDKIEAILDLKPGEDGGIEEGDVDKFFNKLAVLYDEQAGRDDIDYAESYLGMHADAISDHPKEVSANVAKAVKVVQEEKTPFYATWWSILPAIIAIVLALITKEVYSSLFIGILSGAILWSNFSFEGTLTHFVSDGFVASLADSYNVGILIFLVLLGALVSMMNKAGGSAAFGRWASSHIKTRVGAQLATIALGVLIFVDDYFNCLTVGSVMRPVCDAKKISRAKLSYLIDATAAPVCIIAPISSWAAAVAGFAPDGDGIGYFIKAIPFNFYAILTIIMMVTIAFIKLDYGPMKLHEKNAEEKGDIFTTLREATDEAEEKANEKGKVIDLILPVVILIICCIIGMIYSGGFFEGETFVDAFSNCDASVGLSLGSFVAIILVAVYFMVFRHGVMKFSELMNSIPAGFKAMVPAILILTCAWTLKNMTDSLGATVFIADAVSGSAESFAALLPAIIFLIACGLSFATGTSWGTFGILIPIVLAVFAEDRQMSIIAMSACMAGAVCGDHCSPISDTTIMASAGAQCNHVNHVNTQLPYAMTVAAVSFVSYIIAGFVESWLIALPVAIALMIGTLFVIKTVTQKKAK